jgi:DNA modification methylase
MTTSTQASEPSLEVSYVDTDSLVPYARNSKLHPDAQVSQIAASIERFGFDDPVGVWTRPDGRLEIVEGHGRVLAAKELGIGKVPVVRLDHLDDDARRAYSHVHNQTTLTSGMDPDLLAQEMADIPDFAWEDFGFTMPDIAEETPVSEMVEQDEVPEGAESHVSPGQLWRLGEHMLLCGDSTNPADVDRLMGGERARLLFTSPPYSDMRTYGGDKDVSVRHLSEFVGAFAAHADYLAVNLGLKYRDHEVVPYWDEYIAAAHGAGLKLVSWNVWDKGMAGSIGNQDHMFPLAHEWIFVFGEREDKGTNRVIPKKQHRTGSRDIRTRNADGSFRVQERHYSDSPLKPLESVAHVTPETGNIRSSHPAVFPVELPSLYVAGVTGEGDVVAEPFSGSGTTIVACEQLGRRCRAMELDPAYCDIAIARWERLTGRGAELVEREGGDAT